MVRVAGMGDGAPVELLPGARLSAQAPAGQHVHEFRYEPWDVPVGLALGLLGARLSAALLLPPRLAAAVRVWLAMASDANLACCTGNEADVPPGAT